MVDEGKKNVLGVEVDAVDYEAAVARIVSAAKSSQPHSCTALAVHGVRRGYSTPNSVIGSVVWIS